MDVNVGDWLVVGTLSLVVYVFALNMLIKCCKKIERNNCETGK